MRIKCDDNKEKKIPYPNVNLEKLDSTTSTDIFSEQLNVGDSVDCYSEDGGRGWCRGKVANINDCNSCDVIYWGGFYESNIPMNQNKLRLINRCHSYEWMVGKSARLSRAESDKINENDFPSGTVSAVVQKECKITFSDGSSDLMSCDKVARSVFRHQWKECPAKKRYVWPVACNDLSIPERAKLRRRTQNMQKAIHKYASPKPSAKPAPTASKNVVTVKVTLNGKRYASKSLQATLAPESIGTIITKRRARSKKTPLVKALLEHSEG